MATQEQNGRLVTVLERFTFVDGVRVAWVTYRIVGDGNPRCISAREFDVPGRVDP